MILLITEYEWKLEETHEDGSAVLDIIPTVGGQLPSASRSAARPGPR